VIKNPKQRNILDLKKSSFEVLAEEVCWYPGDPSYDNGGADPKICDEHTYTLQLVKLVS